MPTEVFLLLALITAARLVAGILDGVDLVTGKIIDHFFNGY